MLHLATAFGIDAVAEGVETDSQREWLRDEGCEYAQGYLFAPPVDAATATAHLARQVSRTA